MKLTDTQMAILTAAAPHPEHLAYPPERLRAAARQAVAKALLKCDLVIAVHRPAYDAIAKWTVDGDEMLLKVTDEGLRAIGLEPTPPAEEDEQSEAVILQRTTERRAAETATVADTARTGGEEPEPEGEGASAAEAVGGASTRGPHANLRDAAATVLAAWDDEANRAADIISALDGSVQASERRLPASPPASRASRASRAKPRSRSRCSPCSAAPRARRRRRSPRLPAGRRTRCAASSPV